MLRSEPARASNDELPALPKFQWSSLAALNGSQRLRRRADRHIMNAELGCCPGAVHSCDVGVEVFFAASRNIIVPFVI